MVVRGQLVRNGRGNPVQTGASVAECPRPTGQFSLGSLRCKANPAPVLRAAATSRNVIDDWNESAERLPHDFGNDIGPRHHHDM
jgi:hypothetical protein